MAKIHYVPWLWSIDICGDMAGREVRTFSVIMVISFG